FKHQGFYAYRKPALEAFHRWPQSPLELTEKLEQLRFLENGIDIVVVETTEPTIGVDTEADLQAVAALMAERARPAPGSASRAAAVCWRHAETTLGPESSATRCPGGRARGIGAHGVGALGSGGARRAEQSLRRPGAPADGDAERRERVRPRRAGAPE